MDADELVSALRCPPAYPDAVDTVEVRQTHISLVFLAGQQVYKIKRAVRLPFLDFSTLEMRRHFCEEEVRLNRRLADHVYLGVVPVARQADGSLHFEGEGEVIEWAVKMQRLDDDATLQHALLTGGVDVALVRRLAQRIAEFHAKADTSDEIADFARFDVVAKNVRENLTEARDHVGETIHADVLNRLIELSEAELETQRVLIDARARVNLARDTHGDLRLEHVYLFPDRAAPADMVVIDCIEFNKDFRYADPVADMAFLAMGFSFFGRRDLAQAFAASYFETAGDADGARLLPLYVSYRAAVRGKVAGIKLSLRKLPDSEREKTLTKARAYWLLALGELEAPAKRPSLVLIGGLPGSGKSTLAARLAECANFTVIRSDVVRKELAGHAANSSARYGEGLYTSDWNDRTYAECLRRAEELLFAGQRVIIDASFRDEERRRAAIEAATRWGVPSALLICQADETVIRERLAARRGDVSDADWKIYQRARDDWDYVDADPSRAIFGIDTGSTLDASLQQAIAALQRAAMAP